MERGVYGVPWHAIMYMSRLLPGRPVFLYNFQYHFAQREHNEPRVNPHNRTHCRRRGRAWSGACAARRGTQSRT